MDTPPPPLAAAVAPLGWRTCIKHRSGGERVALLLPEAVGEPTHLLRSLFFLSVSLHLDEGNVAWVNDS